MLAELLATTVGFGLYAALVKRLIGACLLVVLVGLLASGGVFIAHLRSQVHQLNERTSSTALAATTSDERQAVESLTDQFSQLAAKVDKLHRNSRITVTRDLDLPPLPQPTTTIGDETSSQLQALNGRVDSLTNDLRSLSATVSDFCQAVSHYVDTGNVGINPFSCPGLIP